MVVVFPAPFGPSNPRISPGLMSNEISLTATNSPNRFTKCWTRRIGVDMNDQRLSRMMNVREYQQQELARIIHEASATSADTRL
jgi:hypothetical protein